MKKLIAKISPTYRIRHGFGFKSIETLRQYEALMEFIQDELAADTISEERRRLYEFTLQLNNLVEVELQQDTWTNRYLRFDDGKHYWHPVDFIMDYVDEYRS